MHRTVWLYLFALAVLLAPAQLSLAADSQQPTLDQIFNNANAQSNAPYGQQQPAGSIDWNAGTTGGGYTGNAGQNIDPASRQRMDALNDFLGTLKDTPASGGSLGLTDSLPGQGSRLNKAFVTLTGQAVNPLFGVTALGMYNYYRTDAAARDRLPIYYQPKVWVPLLIILGLMLCNSTICEAIPLLKVPLNALGDVVNKGGAVVVLPMVIKMFADTVAHPAGQTVAWAVNTVFPSAHAAEGGIVGTAYHSAGWLVGAVIGALAYAAVWLAFNVVDVLILICPFPGVDAVLKTCRLAMVGILAGTNQLTPSISIILAIGMTLVCLLIAGWSFRLSVFGWIFATDILFFRHRDPENSTLAFATVGMKQRMGIPMRTLGHLEKTEGGQLAFTYKPWLVLSPRTVNIGNPGAYSAGRGLLNPFLVADAKPDEPWLRLPPRYRGREDRMVSVFALRRVVDCGVGGTLRSWLAEHFGKKSTATS